MMAVALAAAMGAVPLSEARAAEPEAVMEPAAGAETGAALSEPARKAAFYAIALTMSVACISAGYAVGKVGAAALGAAVEKPELLGRALIFVGLAEGIAIYGLIIAIMLIRLL